MFEGHRVVCVTPAGRRRYLRLLAPQVLGSALVDEYQLWNNTTDEADVEFINELAALDSRVRILQPAELPPGSPASISQFYKHCVEANTVYVRFDDDIVFIEAGFFPKFLRFRLDNPNYFVVFPNIINNAICTYIQSARGWMKPGAMLHPWCMDVTAWGNPRFAEQLHRSFLRSFAQGSLDRWRFGTRLIALARFSVNCMSWLGSDFALFGGEVVGDEEEYLSVTKPSALMRVNCIDGDALVSHFAFRTQRAHLDSTDLVARYAQIRRDGAHPAAPPAVADGDLWTPRLLDAITSISSASEGDLMDVDFLAGQIRHAGLILDKRFLYGDDNRYMNTERVGLWQLPKQLARCLVQLGRYRIRRIIDIGTAAGWTIALLTAYLARFNEGLRVLTIDVRDDFSAFDVVRQILPIEFEVGRTAADFAGQTFDLAFIDGDHSYEGCRRDYESVGRRAPLCIFHDIQDQFVAAFAANRGGVPRLWSKIKQEVQHPDAVFEFLDHSHGEKVMGLGLVVRDSAIERQPALGLGPPAPRDERRLRCRRGRTDWRHNRASIARCGP